MAVNVAATGAWARIANETITQFADDSAPFQVSNTAASHVQFDINGDFVKTSKWSPIEISISVIGGSEDDYKLWILLQQTKPQSNLSAEERRSLFRSSTFHINTREITLDDGMLIDGPDSLNVSQEGRITASTYTFSFKSSKYTSLQALNILYGTAMAAANQEAVLGSGGIMPAAYQGNAAISKEMDSWKAPYLDSNPDGLKAMTEAQKGRIAASNEMNNWAAQNPGKQPVTYNSKTAESNMKAWKKTTW